MSTEIITTWNEFKHFFLLPPNVEREYTALVRGHKAGYVSLADMGEGVWKLDGLYVYPIFRHMGVATALLAEACAHADSLGLGLVLRAVPTDERTDEAGLRRLYERAGFQPIFGYHKLRCQIGAMARQPRLSPVSAGTTDDGGYKTCYNVGVQAL